MTIGLPMHSGHPLMIHLPIVAFPLAVLADAVAAGKQDRRLREFATVMWWLGLLGAAAAVGSGLLAYDRVEHSETAHDLMTLHRNLALAAVGVLVLVGLMRWRRPFSRVAAAVGILGAVGIGGVAYLGGEIVYRHALGLPTETLERVLGERGGHGHGTMPASGGVAPEADSVALPAHEHREGAEH